jgi:hypothetical protein
MCSPPGADVSTEAHAELAVDVLLALYDPDHRSADQEVLCMLLAHLHIAAPLPAPLLVKLSILLQHVETVRLSLHSALHSIC